jgi:3-hydroxymyristoyl/3-hydroxydecanoyl-(acyl carrier protein) dehydratase
VAEAIGQLVSWQVLAKNGFTARPVFAFCDAIELGAPVVPGETVRLTAKINALDGESFRFDGEAHAAAGVAARIRDVNGYFMPLAELEDPAAARRRYEALTSGGVRDPGGHAPFAFAGLGSDVQELVAGASIRVAHAFASDAPFYADHFPRFPVTPAVLLNELIGAAAQRLVGASRPGTRLVARTIRGVKIRSFVRPGEAVEAGVTILSQTAGGVLTRAELKKDGRLILRGEYGYELTEATP